MQHLKVGGLTGELDFNMVEFLTRQIGRYWFTDAFEFKGKEQNGYVGIFTKPTLQTFKSRYGVI